MKENLHEVCVVTYCPFCGKAHEIEVNEIDYLDWQDGELVQNAFPYLSADEREMLVSGICPDCWNKMFGQAEDEDSLDDEDFDGEYAEGFTADLDMGFDPYLGCYTDDC